MSRFYAAPLSCNLLEISVKILAAVIHIGGWSTVIDLQLVVTYSLDTVTSPGNK